MTLTRLDLCVFVCALQRHQHKPTVEHVQRLNKLLRWIQRNPRKLRYPPLHSQEHLFMADSAKNKHTELLIISDAAFKKEEDKGHVLRGALYLRSNNFQLNKNMTHRPMHILDWACKAQRHVSRSTFSAELLSAGEALDHSTILARLIREVEVGPMTPLEARDLSLAGGYCPTTLLIDAQSVFAAVTAAIVKPPADKSLLSHVQYVRSLLDSGVLTRFGWIDTRDMYADGLTKGAVNRQQLHECMEGKFRLLHESKLWSPRSCVAQQSTHFVFFAVAAPAMSYNSWKETPPSGQNWSAYSRESRNYPWSEHEDQRQRPYPPQAPETSSSSWTTTWNRGPSSSWDARNESWGSGSRDSGWKTYNSYGDGTSQHSSHSQTTASWHNNRQTSGAASSPSPAEFEWRRQVIVHAERERAERES